MIKHRTLPRLFVNIFMLGLVLVSMLNKITGNVIHESIGMAIIPCLALHVFLNINWYYSIFKRKITFQRLFNTIVIALLVCVLCALLLSSIMISKSLFSFLEFKSTLMLRQIHTTSAYWFFILSFIHLGIQWQRFGICFKKFRIQIKLSHRMKALLSLLIVGYEDG